MKLIIRRVKSNDLRRNHPFIQLCFREVLKPFATVHLQMSP